MNIIIVGMGEVGKHIAGVLIEENHNVVIIDLDEDALQRAEERFDAMTLMGHGASVSTLQEAGVEKCHLFIAVTDNSEVNLISAIRARDMGAARTIARVAVTEYFEQDRGLHSGLMGIDLVINPQTLVAQELHKIVRSTNAVAVEDFANNRIEMIQLRTPQKKGLTGVQLKDLRMPDNTLVAGVIRAGSEIIVASGQTMLHENDEALIVGRIEQIPRVEKLFERERTRYTRRVIIVGGSQVGAQLAEALVSDGIEVILLEKDRDRCWELSEALEHVVILNVDGTNVGLLQEERVDESDAVVAVSGDDEVNFLAALLAKDMGAPRVIALVHKPDYLPVCDHLGIHATVSPRLEVAKQVLKYVRAGEVAGIIPVLEGKGEFLEFVTPPDARIVGTPIKEVKFPAEANICSVVDREGAYVPRGDDVIEAGDRVIVFTTPKHRATVERFFKRPSGSRLLG